MQDDLQDALVPVKWAEAQIPILQHRLISWHRREPYKIITEDDPEGSGLQLIAAKWMPLDPLIFGDVGAIINSARTALDLLITAVIARHCSVKAKRAPNFPIHLLERDFLGTVNSLEREYSLTGAEASAIKAARAYKGGDRRLWSLSRLDNMRKHERLLRVRVRPTMVSLRNMIAIPVMRDMDDKTILFKVPPGQLRTPDGDANLSAEVFFDEAATDVPNGEVILWISAIVSAVRNLLESFP